MHTNLNITQLSPTLHRIQIGEKRIDLLGTAHISQNSAQEIIDLCAKESYDSIGIELDPERLATLEQKNRWETLDIFQVIKKQQAGLLIVQMTLAAMQKRMGSHIGQNAGIDMKTALDEQKKRNVDLVLLDRSIKSTLTRAWRLSSLWQKNTILASLLSSVFDKSEVEEHELEQLKEGNAVDHLMQEMGTQLPSIKSVLIDERDQYLANSIFDDPHKQLLAVVGLGHVQGILAHLNKRQQKQAFASNQELSALPPKSKLGKITLYTLPILLVSALAFIYITQGQSIGNQLSLTWVLYNFACTALFSVFSLGHPLAILVGGIAAPITSLIPIIGVSLFSGLTQALLRKPQVQDFEKLHQNIDSFKGWYSNRLTKVLLVMICSTIGSSLGTFLAAAQIIERIIAN